jgi:hypothetical protein
MLSDEQLALLPNPADEFKELEKTYEKNFNLFSYWYKI